MKEPSSSKRHEELGDFTTDLSVIKISVLALGIGCLSALIAKALLWLIAFFTNVAYFGRFSAEQVTPGENHLGIFAILVPALGGLVIGLMARYGSDKIRGHGIPEALEAILIGQSTIGAKVAFLKPLSSAISIGTGGPFGAEGPIIMTGGAAGSLCAQWFHLTSAERKTLLVAGAAGGMSAVFATPVAAVLLAVELLLFEWKPRSLIPVSVASVAAAAFRVPLLGEGPIFPVVSHATLGVGGLAWAALIGLLVGFGSGLLTTLVYGFEDLFPKLRIHWMWWPMIGGLFVGVGGLIDPRVLGVGYGTIHSLLNGQILGMALVGLLVGKAVVWSFALGSGTSGGVLAPLLMMGGALGAFVGQYLPVGIPGLWAMVGMSAMMGGTMRAPFTAVLFTLELTYDIHVVPALLIASISAEAVTVLWLKRSILTEKIARRGHHLTREYTTDPFEVHRIHEVMERDVPKLDADAQVSSLQSLETPLGRWFASRPAMPIVDERLKVVGVISQGDLLCIRTESDADQTVLQAGSSNPYTVHADDVVRQAVVLMLKHGVRSLPVVDLDGILVGYVDRSSILDARLRWYHEEHIREAKRGPLPRQEIPNEKSRIRGQRAP